MTFIQLEGYREYLKNKILYIEKDEVLSIKGFKPLIEQRFNYGHVFTEKYTYAVRKGKSLIVNKNGELYDCKPFTNESIYENYIIYKEKDFLGLSDLESSFYLPAKYKNFEIINKTILAHDGDFKHVYENKNFCSIIESKEVSLLNEQIIISNGILCDLQFNPLKIKNCSVIFPEREGIIMIQNKGFIGFADADGEIIIQPKYSSAMSFSEGLARVKEDNDFKLIDKNGNTVFYQANIIPFSKHDSYIAFKQNSFIGIMDSKYNVIIEPKFQYILQDRVFGKFIIDLTYKPQFFSLESKNYILSSFAEILPMENFFICKNNEGKYILFDKNLYPLIDDCDLISLKDGILSVMKNGYMYFYIQEQNI